VPSHPGSDWWTTTYEMPDWQRLALKKARRQARETEHWKELRRCVLECAGAVCEACGIPPDPYAPRRTDRFLYLHHLTYGRLGCELMADVVLLCNGCHQAAHGRVRMSHEEKLRRARVWRACRSDEQRERRRERDRERRRRRKELLAA
jgi:hypothetical protein